MNTNLSALSGVSFGFGTVKHMSLVIGSRGSQLALWQANFIASELKKLGVESAVKVIKTTGDHLQTMSLTQAGGKGLFTKEIEEALLIGSIDLAVHSLKDLPTESPQGLTIAAVPERADPRDAIVGCPLSQLPQNARVGTSSGRRASQLRILRPDLRAEPIRGNVDTRLRKLKEGQFDAIVLAAAGLHRLGLSHEITELLAPEQSCPAPGQGALAIQTREDDPAETICAQLDHLPTRNAVTCERTVLAALGGGCQLPLGAFAEIAGDALRGMAVASSLDGVHYLRAEGRGPQDRPEELGHSLAQDLLLRGVVDILCSPKAVDF
jgi:hydroxymethylbilane synthase